MKPYMSLPAIIVVCKLSEIGSVWDSKAEKVFIPLSHNLIDLKGKMNCNTLSIHAN